MLRRKPKSVAEVVNNIQQNIEDLEIIAAGTEVETERYSTEIDRLNSLMEASKFEGARAKRVSDKLRALIE